MNNNNNYQKFDNIILSYLRQTNKSQKQVVIEAYQTLSLKVNNKSKLLKKIILELLKQRRLHSSDKEDLDLNLYLVLGFTNPSINMLYLSENELKSKLLNEHKKENDINVKLDLILSNIMTNLTRYLRDTTTFEKREEIRNLFKKERFQNSSNNKCEVCNNYRDCDSGMGYCNKCPGKSISFCGDDGSDIDCCKNIQNNIPEENSTMINDSNIIGLNNDLNINIKYDYNLFENHIDKNDTETIKKMNTIEDIYAEYVDVDPNFVLGEDRKLYYYDKYSNVLTEVNFKNNPWKLTDVQYFLKKYDLTKNELRKHLIPKPKTEVPDNENNTKPTEVNVNNVNKKNDVNNLQVEEETEDEYEEEEEEVDAEELIYLEKRKKVRKKASIYLKIIFYTIIVLTIFYLIVSIYTSFKSNRPKTRSLNSRSKLNLNNNRNISLNNSTRQRISNNTI